jgi:uncharacterized surface protein with fasciclin (FAS1) repeats
MLRRFLTVLVLGLAPLAAAQTIVDVAAGNDDFETLVAAVEAAGLVDTLSSDGPFTVFAPTDDAFAQIPSEQLDAILADTELLTSILTYHVVPGEVTAEQVVGLSSADTVQGQAVTIQAGDAGVRVNDANVVATDVMASNGVIHVIDTVLLPPSVTAPQTQSIVLPVSELNDSGVSGTVTIDRFLDGSLVTLSLDGTPAGGDHPAHFHAGDCDAPGSVVLPLNNVSGDTGLSVTALDAPIETILEGNHLVMVHLSPDDIATFVACGEVGAGAPGL